MRKRVFEAVNSANVSSDNNIAIVKLLVGFNQLISDITASTLNNTMLLV